MTRRHGTRDGGVVLVAAVALGVVLGAVRVEAQSEPAPTALPDPYDPTEATGALIIEDEPAPDPGVGEPLGIEDPHDVGKPTDVDDPGTDDPHGAIEGTGAHAAAADNTGRNVRDRGGRTLTPMDQSGAPGDLATTRRIRRALVGSDELSMTAKNVKIITTDGIVTLRGPVRTRAEKDTVARVARGAAGSMPVHDQLEVVQGEQGEH